MVDSMRPSTNWGQEAREFRELTGQQLLCCICVSRGVTKPPAQMLIRDGNSVCLEHYPGPRDWNDDF